MADWKRLVAAMNARRKLLADLKAFCAVYRDYQILHDELSRIEVPVPSGWAFARYTLQTIRVQYIC